VEEPTVDVMTAPSVADALAMGLLGFATTALVPLLVLATRRRAGWARLWTRLTWPAGLTLPLFALLHAACTVLPAAAARTCPPQLQAALDAVVLAAAVPLWLPVLSPARRLSDAARCVYLFLAGPLLDLSALALIALDQSVCGIAMITGMLPLGFAAFAFTWRWAVREERAERQRDLATQGV
jgi:hypothetical protein